MEQPNDIYHWASFIGTVFLCVTVVAVGAVVAVINFKAQWRDDILRDHFAAIVGLPCAAAAAFIIVTLFRQLAGEIKLNAMELQFEGASGPVVLWVLCFMALTVALKMVWPLKP